MRDVDEHDLTDPALRQPIETAPHDGTVIQIGGPYEWIKCRWDLGQDAFVLHNPGHFKNGSQLRRKDQKFWRPDDGKG